MYNQRLHYVTEEYIVTKGRSSKSLALKLVIKQPRWVEVVLLTKTFG